MGQEFGYWCSFVDDVIEESGSAFIYKQYHKGKVTLVFKCAQMWSSAAKNENFAVSLKL